MRCVTKYKGENFELRTFEIKRRVLLLVHSLPVLRWAGANNDLPSTSNISKTVRKNIACIRTFFKDYSISLIDFALVFF